MNILRKLTTNYLKLNRKRTIVTMIGIIISGAMITAVATLAVSFQDFMLKVEISQDGAWEANFKNVKTEDIATIQDDKRFTDTMIMAPVGMVQNTYSEDEFLYIKAYDKQAMENMKVRLIEGRLPQNENEIVLSRTFFDGKENEPKIGETITIDVGKRMSEGSELTSQLKQEKETFVKEESKTYLVCGKIEKPDFESSRDYYTSGITILDEAKLITAKTVDIGVISKNVKNLYKDTEEIADKLGMYQEEGGEKSYQINYNTYVLAYKGVNQSDGFQQMLYSVCGVLIVVIMIGSILVIYNSFAISVSERKKQFGMLASVGATKRQIKKTVIYEGMTLGILGIPLGILSGILGIGITLKVVDNLLKPIIAKEVGNWSLDLVISWQAIAIAVVLIALTIYLSVTLPAKRASKISPIEAIRGNNEMKIKAKKLKTPKLMRKLFGMEGEMALKNLKRSKKRYRTTVLSLMISIILFVSVSGFVEYMYSGFDSLYESADYDYKVSIYMTQNEERQREKDEVKKQIESTELVDKLTITEEQYGINYASKDKMDSKVLNKIEEEESVANYFNVNGETCNIQVSLITLNEAQMKNYLKEIGVQKLEDNQIILIQYVDMLKTLQLEGEITNYKEKETLDIETIQYGEGKEENKYNKTNYEIAKVTDKMPYAIKNVNYPKLIAITTQKGLERTQNETFSNIYITAKNDKELESYINQIKVQYPELDMHVQNVKEQVQMQRNLKTIISIFLYGFIALISAIGVANIFNTISTNINLRRREFAMLKSIGMTDKGFKKMLDLECVFYGTKALLYGLPIGIFICFLINKGFGNMVEFVFQLPWQSIIISIIAVYLVVFITMIYSSSKIKKENIMDVLKNENT